MKIPDSILLLVALVICLLGGGLAFWWLWNYLMPQLWIGAPILTFWQALWIWIFLNMIISFLIDIDDD